MKKRVLAFLTVVLTLALAGVARAEKAQSRITLMIYMCGSNLESEYGSASADIDEMVFSGVDTRQANVLVMTGGSVAWSNGQYADATQISRLRGGQMITMWEADAMNMGDAATLTTLIDWSVANYPAERYALILWDHGAGPLEGVCFDELNTPDRLSLDELTRALEASSLPGKLGWIGFDACLMGTLEVASKLAPYAKYMIASQEREPASGWDYDFLRGIEADADGAATGRRIVDTYMEYPRNTPSDLTLACVDLSAIAPVEDCLDALYGTLAAGLTRESFSGLSRLRFSAKGFGKAVETREGSQGYDLVDIVSLSRCLAKEEDADEVRRTVEHAVVYHQENLEDCCGLSLYHPFRNRGQFRAKWGRAYDELDFCAGYSAYVNSYGKIMSGEQLVLWNNLNDIQASGDESEDDRRADGAAFITLKLSQEQAKNLASARLVVLARNVFDQEDAAFFRVFSSADVSVNGTVISSVYDGSSMQILNESGSDALTGAVSYRVSEDGLYMLDIYPVEADGTRWKRPIIAEYEREAGGWLRLRGYSIYDELTGAYTSRADVDLSQFRGVTFINDYRLATLDAEGEILAFDQWDEDAHRDLQMKSRYYVPRTAFMPSLAMAPLMAEDLYGCFEITDTQGNTYMSELTRLTQESSVEYYSSQGVIGDDIPNLGAALVPYWEDRDIWLYLYAENLSDSPQSYAVWDMEANDTRIGDPFFTLLDENYEIADSLEPGEHGIVALEMDAEMLENLSAADALERVSGTLAMITKGRSPRTSYIRFSAEPGISLDSVFHEEGSAVGADESIEDLPLSLVVGAEDQTALRVGVVLQPALYAQRSRILINLSLDNRGDRDVAFGAGDVSLNGVSIAGATVQDQATGKKADERTLVLPGESRTLNIVLRYDDVERIMPDVALNRASFQLLLATMEDGKVATLNKIPIDIDLSVPLDCFYTNAVVLPPQELVDLVQEANAADSTDGASLFRDAPCDTRLQALYAVDKNIVMLLRFENNTEKAQRVNLGQAELDGASAAMGTQINVLAEARNNRNRTYFLDKPEWEPESGVGLTLQPGQTAYSYVTVTPGDARTQARRIGFGACMYEHGEADAYAYYDRCEIDTGDYVPLTDGTLGASPLSELAVTPGEAILQPEASPLFRDDVLMPEGDLSGWSVPLEFTPEADESIDKAYYVLLRRAESDAELAALNIDNDVSPDTHASEVSFADGRQWLLYEGCGRMDIDGDGRSARAEYPGLRPVIRSSGESFPLTVTLFGRSDDGRLTFEEIMNAVYFYASEYPNAFAPFCFGNVTVTCDIESGAAKLKACNVSGGEMVDVLRGLVCQDVFLTPLDMNPDDLIALIEGEGGAKQKQVQLLEGPTMQLAVEPIEDVERYMIAFYYKNTAGETRCALPRPLSEFTR